MKELGDEDVALKLLHTADWHLGRRFQSFDEPDQQKLSRARLEAVRRLLDLAEQHGVDAVLCAGDVFDDPDPERVWWEGLRDCLRERSWPERPLFLLPGNHDPLMPKSIWAADSPLRAALPEWVHVVDREGYSYELGDGAVLYASPCTSQAGSSDLAMALPRRQAGDERIRIGMVHGRTFHAEGYQTNFPIDPEAAKKRGFDYLALGDEHAYQRVPPHDIPPTVYPSAPEPTTFGEPDAGYCALVFFRRRNRRAVVNREKVGQWTWRQETARDLASLRALREPQNLRQTVLRLVVDFEVSLPEYQEVRGILDELKGTEAIQGRVGVLQVDTSGLKIDITDAESQFEGLPESLPESLQAAVAKLIVVAQEQAAEQGGETARRALWNLYRLVRETQA